MAELCELAKLQVSESSSRFNDSYRAWLFPLMAGSTRPRSGPEYCHQVIGRDANGSNAGHWQYWRSRPQPVFHLPKTYGSNEPGSAVRQITT